MPVAPAQIWTIAFGRSPAYTQARPIIVSLSPLDGTFTAAGISTTKSTLCVALVLTPSLYYFADAMPSPYLTLSPRKHASCESKSLQGEIPIQPCAKVANVVRFTNDSSWPRCRLLEINHCVGVCQCTQRRPSHVIGKSLLLTDQHGAYGVKSASFQSFLSKL